MAFHFEQCVFWEYITGPMPPNLIETESIMITGISIVRLKSVIVYSNIVLIIPCKFILL